MLITWLMSDLHCCGFVRAEMIARELNRVKGTHMCCKTNVSLSDFFGTDVMVFQRSHSADMLDRIRACSDHGIKSVYEIDDDLFCVPDVTNHASVVYGNDKTRGVMRECMNAASAVTVSTEYLANKTRARCPNAPIYIVENGVDLGYWDVAVRARKPKPYIEIGWMASQSHLMDAPIIHDALSELMHEFPNLHLHMIGWIDITALGKDMKKFTNRIHAQQWIPIDELPFTMNQFDIGLAPLVDCEFNRSKSCLKYLQTSALGIPCVASDVTPYKEVIHHGRNGFLSDDQSWYRILRELVMSKELRAEVGSEARRYVEKWNSKAMASCWASVFDHIARR